MNIIFLDVDGVLNNRYSYEESEVDGKIKTIKVPGTYDKGILSPNKYTGIEDRFVEILKEIILAVPDTHVVLTSDWKNMFTDDFQIDKNNPNYKDGEYLVERLASHGITILARTLDRSNGLDYSSRRGLGIKNYIKKHNVENYVILDDIPFVDFNEGLEYHFIRTSSYDGLTEENKNTAIDILNGKLLDDKMIERYY